MVDYYESTKEQKKVDVLYRLILNTSYQTLKEQNICERINCIMPAMYCGPCPFVSEENFKILKEEIKERF